MSNAVDVSVLGYSAEDLAGMDAEERADAMREVLNRAADMLQAAADAFAREMGAGRSDVTAAAQSVIAVARGSFAVCDVVPVQAPPSAPAARKPYRVYRKAIGPRPEGCDFDTEEPAIERCKALAKAEPGIVFYVDSPPNARTIFRANGNKARRT